MRALAGIVVGILLGVVSMALIALIGGAIFPAPMPPGGLTREAAVGAFSSLPAGAKAFVILAWLVGGFVGAVSARLIARARWAAWVVIVLFTIYVIATVMVLPMPGWLQALGVLAPLVGGALGDGVAGRRAGLATLSEEPEELA